MRGSCTAFFFAATLLVAARLVGARFPFTDRSARVLKFFFVIRAPFAAAPFAAPLAVLVIFAVFALLVVRAGIVLPPLEQAPHPQLPPGARGENCSENSAAFRRDPHCGHARELYGNCAGVSKEARRRMTMRQSAPLTNDE